ncbi:MAG TPA: hypothetical protein VHO69_13270 [Phototrophicaceae bacterium]|nr:hypothetical protein [Phototrophicaceae bacterium]
MSAYLQRLKVRPSLDDLTRAEAHYLHHHFDTFAGEVVINGETIHWDWIEAVEIAKAARAAGPAGWLVRYFVHGNERYHVGIYGGQRETVLTNVTLHVARFITQAIAFYSPAPVAYTGPEGFSPTAPAQETP